MLTNLGGSTGVEPSPDVFHWSLTSVVVLVKGFGRCLLRLRRRQVMRRGGSHLEAADISRHHRLQCFRTNSNCSHLSSLSTSHLKVLISCPPPTEGLAHVCVGLAFVLCCRLRDLRRLLREKSPPPPYFKAFLHPYLSA